MKFERPPQPPDPRPRLWVTGAFLIFGGFMAGVIRPEPASEAQAVGRMVGQIVLMASGIVLVLIDLVRSRSENGDHHES